MPFYATATDCHFFKPDSKALDPYPLPLDEITFERTGKLLRVEYGHRLYYLGIAGNGTLVGFRALPTKDSTADLVILKTGLFRFVLFQRRFHNEEQVEAEVAAFSSANLAGGAYSCGYRDYQQNLDGFQRPPAAFPSGAFPPAPFQTPYTYPGPGQTLPQAPGIAFAPELSAWSGQAYPEPHWRF